MQDMPDCEGEKAERAEKKIFIAQLSISRRSTLWRRRIALRDTHPRGFTSNDRSSFSGGNRAAENGKKSIGF